MIKLRRELFWDTEFKNLTYDKYPDYIIGRVLNYGEIKDIKEIKKVYGLKKIKEVAKKAYLDRKSLNFWSLILNIPIKQFKCMKKFSIEKQGSFSRK